MVFQLFVRVRTGSVLLLLAREQDAQNLFWRRMVLGFSQDAPPDIAEKLVFDPGFRKGTASAVP